MTGFAPTIAAAIVQPGPPAGSLWRPFTAGCCLASAAVTAIWVKETYDVPTEALGTKAPAPPPSDNCSS